MTIALLSIARMFIMKVIVRKPAVGAIALFLLIPTSLNWGDFRKTNSLSSPAADQLQYYATTTGDSLLPYQALPIRLVVQNAGNKRLGAREMPLLDLGGEFKIKTPGHSWHRFVSEMPILHTQMRKNQKISCSRGSPSILIWESFFLDPGEQTSVRFPITVGLGEQLEDASLVTGPVFTTPGIYAIQFDFAFDLQRHADLYRTVQIRVVEPQRADDIAVWRQLAAQPALAEAMLSPIHPGPAALVPKLRELVDRHPRSSYAPYARFALARSVFPSRFWQKTPWKDLVLTERSERLQAALAIRELEQCRSLDFPYRAYVLVELYWLHFALDEPELCARVREQLLHDHFDEEIVTDLQANWIRGENAEYVFNIIRRKTAVPNNMAWTDILTDWEAIITRMNMEAWLAFRKQKIK
jgi:hypothetical protein